MGGRFTLENYSYKKNKEKRIDDQKTEFSGKQLIVNPYYMIQIFSQLAIRHVLPLSSNFYQRK